MHRLELKIPPVAVFVIAMVLINRFAHIFTFAHIPLPYVGVIWSICFVLSGFIGIAGIYEFRKAKTTVNPTKPHQATSIVESGIFHYSRNPMYLGLLLLLIGFAYWQENGLSLLTCVGFIWYMNRFQIEPEERTLTQIFGQPYVDYKTRVRRWI